MKCAVAGALEALDPEACRAFAARRWHPRGALCPGCGGALGERQAQTWAAGGRVRCRACGRWFTCRSGTHLQGSVADERQLYLFALLTAVGCPARVIAEACRLSDDTVRAWQRRLGSA